MNNQSFFFLRNIFCTILALPIFFLAFENHRLLRMNILPVGANELNKNNDINSSFDDSNDSYIPTNPLELMNVLRSIESMGDRTLPSDAIDDALKAFEVEEEENSSIDIELR